VPSTLPRLRPALLLLSSASVCSSRVDDRSRVVAERWGGARLLLLGVAGAVARLWVGLSCSAQTGGGEGSLRMGNVCKRRDAA
jgi:hypothetical protein